MRELYIISLHLFSLLRGVATWSDMPGNTRKKQATRPMTIRHPSIMSGALEDVRSFAEKTASLVVTKAGAE
jgi:hypothetical protein